MDNDVLRYTFKIPYIGNPSLMLKKKLKKLFKKQNIDVNIVFSTTKVGSFFSLKDRTNPFLKASVIYQFKCLGDPSCSYIGKTKRYLQKRIGEHLKGSSAIYSHVTKCKIIHPTPFIISLELLNREIRISIYKS